MLRCVCAFLLAVGAAARRPVAADHPPPAAPTSDPPPSDCGAEAEFVASGWDDVAVADGVVFRARRPDLIPAALAAVRALDAADAFRNATYCAYFGCRGESRSTDAYLPCPSSRRLLAPKWLAGAASEPPPLAGGDGNALCRLARVVAAAAATRVLPELAGRVGAKCVVQESFANVQTRGGSAGQRLNVML